MKTTVFVLLGVFSFICVTAVAVAEDEDFGSGETDEWSWEGLDEKVINDNSQVRIFGGKNASITKYPYMASVIVNGTLRGGAAILNKEWLITSGYTALFAFNPSMMTVRVGSASAFKGGKLYQVKKTELHPYYRGYANDVALIRLKRPLAFGRHIRPIQIGSKPPPTNATVLFTSFGENNDKTMDTSQKYGIGVLKETRLKFMAYKDCQPYYFANLSFSKRSFCTDKNNSTSPAAKDFGSPLVYGRKVIGLFSGKPCGPPKPAVFADLTSLKSWIFRTMKKHQNL